MTDILTNLEAVMEMVRGTKLECFNKYTETWTELTPIIAISERTLSLPSGYRKVRDTIFVNGFEIPKPVSTPRVMHSFYYVPSVQSVNWYICIRWNGLNYNREHLDRGLAHKDKEGAIAHAKALLCYPTSDQPKH